MIIPEGMCLGYEWTIASFEMKLGLSQGRTGEVSEVNGP